MSYANDCVKTILSIHSRQNPRIYLIQNGEIKDNEEGNEDGKKVRHYLNMSNITRQANSCCCMVPYIFIT